MVGVNVRYEHTITSSRIVKRLRQSSRNITLFYRKVYIRWDKSTFRPEGLRQIRTGRGRFPAANVGRWRIQKQARFGIRHSLGILTGRLHAGFANAKTNLRADKARATIVATTRFREPRYFRFVVEGTSRHRAYDFVGSTLTKTIPRLRRDLSKIKERDVLGS